MKENTLTVKPLTLENDEAVAVMDDDSGNYVRQWLEDNVDYAWGLFDGNTLIGYATIGYADDCGDTIEGHPLWTYSSLLLSDVYIMPQYRKKGYATHLVKNAIKMRTAVEKEAVFLILLYDELADFYKKLGFSEIGDACMVKGYSEC